MYLVSEIEHACTRTIEIKTLRPKGVAMYAHRVSVYCAYMRIQL